MPQENERASLEQRAQRAIVQNAFLRWESALIVAGTLLLSFFFTRPFPWWPWWGWPLLGLIAETLIVYTSISDPSTAAKVVSNIFREEFDPRQIGDRELRGKVAQAVEYRERIDQTVAEQRQGALREHLTEMSTGIDDWVSQMFRLARRLEAFRSDGIIARDLQEVPREMERLSARLRLETDAEVRQQMESTLASVMVQQRSLSSLEDTMERAALQMDHSLAALGTLYSQVLLIGAREVDSGRTQRLREDIRQQVLRLQDMIDSINAVYNYRVEGVGQR